MNKQNKKSQEFGKAIDEFERYKEQLDIYLIEGAISNEHYRQLLAEKAAELDL